MPLTTLPDFSDEKWDAERIRLQEAMAEAVFQLITHMSGPGPIGAKIDLVDPNGRPVTLVIEAGACPRPN